VLLIDIRIGTDLGHRVHSGQRQFPATRERNKSLGKQGTGNNQTIFGELWSGRSQRVLRPPRHVSAALDVESAATDISLYRRVVRPFVLVPLDALVSLQDTRRLAGLEDRMRQRAYEPYETRGREDGHDIEDWLRAEEEVSQKKVRPIAA